MLTSELASLKYNDLILEPVDEEGNINYDPEEQPTKGQIHFQTTFVLA